MNFDTIRRDEVLGWFEQAKDQETAKNVLCDFLGCSKKELEALLTELRAERAAHIAEGEPKTAIKTGAWSDGEIERLKKLCAAGKTRSEIAEALCRNPKSVTYKMGELKLKSNTQAQKKPDPDASRMNEQVNEIAAYAKELEREIKLLKNANEKLIIEKLDLEKANSVLKEDLDGLRRMAEKDSDAAVAQGDSLTEELEAAWREAEKAVTEAKEYKEISRRNAERTSRLVLENGRVYDTLSRAVSLCASLGELLKVRV